MPYPTNSDQHNTFPDYSDINNSNKEYFLDGLISALFKSLSFENTHRQYRPYTPALSNALGEEFDKLQEQYEDEVKTEFHDRFKYQDPWTHYPQSLESLDDEFVDFSTGATWRKGFLSVAFLGTILSIDQIVGTNRYISTTLASNQPVSILKPQFNVTQGVNTYPRLTNINNPDTIYGSSSKNPLSSSQEYFSYDDLEFFNYVHYNLVNFSFTPNRRSGEIIVRGNLTPFIVTPDSPIQRRNRNIDATRITTYSPYSNATLVDFTNDGTWINSFFNNPFYWPTVT